MARRRRANRRASALAPNTALREGVYDAVLDGSGIDPDEHLYRSLTGSSRGDNLPAFRQDKAISLAKYLFRTNPVANRFITLLTDFVLGEGVTYATRNAEVKALLDAHWRDPYNDWDRHMPELFQSFLIYGELFMPLFPNPGDGHLRVGQLLPDAIRRVETDPENWRVVSRVVVAGRDGAEEGPAYAVVNLRESPAALADAARPALFWTRANPFGSRGLSILYPLADFLDLLDQLLFSEVERWLLLKAFVWEVKVEGVNAQELAQFKRDNPALTTPPKPGSVVVTNEKVSYEAKTPALETADAVAGLTFLRNHVLGAGGIPEHWYGEGGDVNRAVGAVMAEVPRKRLTALQDEWRHVVRDVLQAQIDYAVAAGTLPAEVPAQDSEGNDTAELIAARDAVEVEMPDLSGDDTAQVATAMQALTGTLALAEGEAYVTKGTARRAFLALLGQLGVEFDPQQEAERAEAEQAQRRADAERAAQAAQPPAQLATLPPRGQRPGDAPAAAVGG